MELDLRGNRLSGSRKVWSFTVRVQLTGNATACDVAGRIPSEICCLPKITRMVLRSNSLAGWHTAQQWRVCDINAESVLLLGGI